MVQSYKKKPHFYHILHRRKVMCKLLGFSLKSVKSIRGVEFCQNQKQEAGTCFIQSALNTNVHDLSYLAKLASPFFKHPGGNHTPTNENISRSELGTKVRSAQTLKFLTRQIQESCSIKLHQGRHVTKDL